MSTVRSTTARRPWRDARAQEEAASSASGSDDARALAVSHGRRGAPRAVRAAADG